MEQKSTYILLSIISLILSFFLGSDSQKDTHIHFEIPNKIVADYEKIEHEEK